MSLADGKINTLSEQNRINVLYEEAYRFLIQKKHDAIQNNKPLLILVGASNDTQGQLATPLMIYEIAQSIGIKKVYMDVTPLHLNQSNQNNEINYPFLISLAKRYQWDISISENEKIESYKNLHACRLNNGLELLSQSAKKLVHCIIKDTSIERWKLYTNEKIEQINTKDWSKLNAHCTKLVNAAKIPLKNKNTMIQSNLLPRLVLVDAQQLFILAESLKAQFELAAFYDHQLPLNIHLDINASRPNTKNNINYLFAKPVALCNSLQEYVSNAFQFIKKIASAKMQLQNKQEEQFKSSMKHVLNAVTSLLNKLASIEEETIANNLIRVIKNIQQDTRLTPDIKCFEFYTAIQESVDLGFKKNILSSLLYQTLRSLERDLYKIKNMSPTFNRPELLQIYRSFSPKL